MGLDEDTLWFQANQGFIGQQYAGQWVLIKDATVHGAYPSYSAAYEAGVQMFATAPFLVREAGNGEPTATI